jgi:hypothetical protein
MSEGIDESGQMQMENSIGQRWTAIHNDKNSPSRNSGKDASAKK